MTDTNGPRPGEPQAGGAAPQEPTRVIPAPVGPPPVGAAYPAAGVPPVATTGQPMPARRSAHGPLVAWVLGGVLVALLAGGVGFAGGFAVGHAVGSHNGDRSVSQFDNRRGPMGNGGMGQWSNKSVRPNDGSGRRSGTQGGSGMFQTPGSSPSATPSPGATPGA